MDWSRIDRTAELHRMIDNLRSDQRAKVQQAEEALCAEQHALGVAEQARAVMLRCKCAIDSDAAEIDVLLDELRGLS